MIFVTILFRKKGNKHFKHRPSCSYSQNSARISCSIICTDCNKSSFFWASVWCTARQIASNSYPTNGNQFRGEPRRDILSEKEVFAGQSPRFWSTWAQAATRGFRLQTHRLTYNLDFPTADAKKDLEGGVRAKGNQKKGIVFRGCFAWKKTQRCFTQTSPCVRSCQRDAAQRQLTHPKNYPFAFHFSHLFLTFNKNAFKCLSTDNIARRASLKTKLGRKRVFLSWLRAALSTSRR